MRRGRLSQLGALWMTTVVAVLAVPRANGAPPTRRNVEIEWDAVEGATAYEVRVTRKDGQAPPLTFKLRRAHWSANVKAGLYLMQLRTYDDRGVPGDWSPPSELVVKLPAVIVKQPAPSATLVARDADEETVKLAWEPIPGARRYRLTVTGGDVRRELTVDGTEADVKLPVAAEYAWNVVGLDPRDEPGESSASPYVFQLNGPALATPRPEAPLTKYVERLRWSAVPGAATYLTELRRYDRARRRWEPVEGPAEVATPEYPFDPRRPAGRYRLSVRAQAPRRQTSPAGGVDFGAAGGFRDEAGMRDAALRESLRLPGAYQFEARYQIGPVDYTSRYAETNAIARLSGAVNGASLGVARPGRRGPWGAAARVDAAAFAIQGRTFVYGGAEARATYRLEPGPRGVLIFDAGLFGRQLPVVIGSPVDGFAKVDRVAMTGPLAGVRYLHPFNERWSARGEARAYYGLGGAFANEVTVGAAYRAGPRWGWGLGLSHRYDEVNFKAKTDATSFAKPGDMDRVTMENWTLTLQVSF